MASPAKRRKISADGQTKMGRSGSTGLHPLRQMSLPVEGDTSEPDSAKGSMSPAESSQPPFNPTATNGALQGADDYEDDDDDENLDEVDTGYRDGYGRAPAIPTGYDSMVYGGLRDMMGGVGTSYANMSADGNFAADRAQDEANAEAEEESMRLRLLLENFDQQQQDRYETFRRANLNKANVKKIANQALGHSITPNVAIAIAGFSKIFVGELVERARRVQALWNESGPVTPEHLREAYRRYKMETNLTPDSSTPVRFR